MRWPGSGPGKRLPGTKAYSGREVELSTKLSRGQGGRGPASQAVKGRRGWSQTA
jgi:hypothetical protein